MTNEYTENEIAEIKAFAEVLLETFNEILEGDQELERAVKEEMRTGEEIIQEEKQDLSLEKNWNKDLSQIQNKLSEARKSLEEDGSLQVTARSLELIHSNLQEIAEGVQNVRNNKENELEELEIEFKDEEEITDSLEVQESNLSKLNQMRNSFSKTVREGNIKSLESLKGRIDHKWGEIQEEIEEIREQQAEASEEITQEEKLVRKELGLEQEIVEDMNVEVKLFKGLISDLKDAEQAGVREGDEYEAVELDELETKVERIGTEMEKIEEHIEKIETLATQEKKALDKTENN